MRSLTQQIHDEFRKDLDLKPIEMTQTVNTEDISILEDVGLTSTKTYKKLRGTSLVNDNVKAHNNVVSRLLEIQAKYPEYRIITLSRVLELCKKYKLAVGELSDYTEMVPMENARELKAYMKAVYFGDLRMYERVQDLLTHTCTLRESARRFYIAAPPKFFHPSLVEVEGFMVKLPKVTGERQSFSKIFEAWIESVTPTDPIVLSPLNVLDTQEVFFHIPTAWDVEAEDDSVTTKVKVNSNLS